MVIFLSGRLKEILLKEHGDELDRCKTNEEVEALLRRVAKKHGLTTRELKDQG